MGTVTGFTAARSAAIEAEAIVSGTISGDNLVLTKHNGETVNAGNVRGPRGLKGDTGDVSAAELAAAISAAGSGIVAFDQATADQSFAFASNTWVDVTGVSVTFTPIPGHYYEFNISAALKSADTTATETNIAVGLRETTGAETVVASGSGFTSDPTWLAPISGKRVILAPGGWTTPRTYKLSVCASTDFEVHIASDVYPAQIFVVDLGTLA